jgi:hypothetical protein
LSTKALREQRTDETGQAWGQKTLRAIKLKIRVNMGQCSLRKEVLSQVLKRSKVLKNCKE